MSLFLSINKNDEYESIIKSKSLNLIWDVILCNKVFYLSWI